MEKKVIINNTKKIIIIVFLIFIIGSIIDIFFWPHYSKEERYLNYLENKYSLKFEILEKIDEPKKINEDYIEVYECRLKNSELSFLVGKGKFKIEVWSLFKRKNYFDTYKEEMRKFLQNKHKKTIIINDENNILLAKRKIENIVDDYSQDFLRYHMNYDGNNKLIVNDYLYLDIIYYDRLISNVEFSTNKEYIERVLLNLNNFKN